MTKKDLKNGMIVEVRNGKRYLIHNNKCIRFEGKFDLITVSDDLKDNFFMRDTEWDIIKVFNSNAPTIEDLFKDKYLKLIWERDDEDSIEMGDKVEVIDNGHLYTRYNEWVERNIADIDDRYKFDMGHKIDNYTKCEVLYIAKHGDGFNADDTLAYVKNLETDRCYLISIDGLEKIK